MEKKKNKKQIVPDIHLWKQVAQSIDYEKSQGIEEKPLIAKMASQAKANTSISPGQSKPRAKGPQPKIKQVIPKEKSPPALTGLDRKTTQRMSRGLVDIEDRLDLHGETAESAKIRFHQFILRSSDRMLRNVLVITGKGNSPFVRHTLHAREIYNAPERDGKIRRLLQQWVNEPEFRQLISGIQPAHPKHGGGGAFYIRLRNKNKKTGRS